VIPEPPLPDDLASLEALIAERLAPGAHGDMPAWQAALEALPALAVERVDFGPTVTLAGTVGLAAQARLRVALDALHPWRKGPFQLFGVHIDTEWRSDWKWDRIAPHLDDLGGQRVLDVGCGNGYFGWRMLAAGAASVTGVDPTLVFCMQHRAVNRYLREPANQVLPVRFEELPEATFDTVFSLGVIYHRRDPVEHAERLYRHTRPGGLVVVESLVVAAAQSLQPRGRYARMRNVWTVPSLTDLTGWLAAAGLVDARVVDVTATTTDEQRSTDWMRFQSLADALDPERPELTVEGHPAPLRAVVLARRPV
jgi:tRNA (mo5U34)-methyltransferase